MEKQISGRLPIERISKFFILQVLLFFCAEVSAQVESGCLQGKWELKGDESQINYPILSFNKDSSAVFSSRADTLYRFNYSIKKNYLILRSTSTPEVTRWEILRLSKDELVFKNLFEHKEKQVYKRARK